jgi:signal transduction histidine kinase
VIQDSVTIVVSPNASDCELTVALLRESGVNAQAFPDLYCLSRTIGGTVGCALIVEDALVESEVDGFREALRTQPAWSDLPIIIVASLETVSNTLVERAFPDTGNVTLLGRPLSPSVLVSTVRCALRSRARQYQVRDLIRERDQSLQRRDEFLAMLAHELRNPLAPIRNAVHLQKMLNINDPVFEKTRTLIDRQVINMTRLVNDLLDVSRLELGKVQIQRQKMNLNDGVLAAVDTCTEVMRERKHTLHLDLSVTPLLIEGDSVRIEQIVCNLLTNAAKYTPVGGDIKVSTFYQGQHAVLAVEDTGVGIPADMAESIFDLFTQNKRTLARSEGGLGIGLTVVRRLIELHGGAITVTSPGEGQGSRFVVRLPAAAAAAAGVPARAPSTSTASVKRRILVVEDNADIRESLDMLLKVWGHEVHFASTGPEGVLCAKTIKPAIAIIDIGLPGLNGYDVARNIRSEASSWPEGVRLIAMTGYGQQSDISMANAAGFDSHLLKPVDPEILETILNQ